MKLSLSHSRRPVLPASFRQLRRHAAAAALMTMISVPTVHAVSGNWISTAATGGWGAAANWSTSPTVPGSTAGDVVNINSNIAANAAITLDANRTVGTLLIGDLDSTNAFSISTGSTLILDQTGIAPALVRFGVAASTAAIGNSIASLIQLNDNARFYTTLTANQTLSNTISGAFSVTYDNDDGTALAGPVINQGQFLVSNGNANSYTGGTTIDDVRVTIQGNNAALGAAGSAVNILDGGQVFNSTGLTAIANAFTIAGNGWLETAGQLGALRLDSGAIVTGTVTMSANAAIGSNSGTGTVNGVVAGTGFTLSKVGIGTIVLGAANTYSGGTTIANGALQLNNATAAGTGAITLAVGGTTGTATRLLINGGVTIANTVSFGAITGGVGLGALQQTGTGLATINGAITITGTPTAGGHFVGGNAATNALVLGGAITSSVGLAQRDGFVRYGGGGTGFTSLVVAGTAQVGATNGLPVGASVQLGVSLAGNLDLNGFDQTLAGLTLGSSGNFNGNALLGTRALTLTSNLTTAGTGVHTITGTGAGVLALGATPTVFTVVDGASVNDLTVSSLISGSAGFTKAGTGTLILNGNVTNTGTLTVTGGVLGGNTAISGPLTLSSGTTLQGGTTTSTGNISSTALTFDTGASTLNLKIGAGGEAITTGALVTNGTAFLQIRQLGGILPNGTYPLINYTGTSPGLGAFSIGGGGVGHTTGGLIDTGTSIAYQITGNDRVVWTGASSTAWDPVSAVQNWKTETGLAATNFVLGDDVVFADGVPGAVVISANVFPSNVTFTNTVATAYTLSGGGGISGTTALTKTGNGLVTLSSPNIYVGATTVAAGTLTADYSTATALGAGTAVDVAAAATLKLVHNGGVFSLVNTLTGAGTVIIDPGVTTAGNRDLATVTWNASAFTGTLNLKPTTGTMRLTVDALSDLGSGPVVIDSGAQMFVSAGALTFANNFTIAGTGYSETAGTLGAIRSNTDTFTGVITVNGSAKIGALGQTATFTNTLTGGTLTFGGSINSASNETLLLTGSGSGLAGLIVNDATGTSGVGTILVSVGSNGATGTLGAVPITLRGDGFKTAVIRFDRTDGYALGAGVTSASPTAANDVRTQLQVDTLGTGFNSNGQTINLGAVATGGAFRVGNVRTGAIANVNSPLTAGSILVSAAAAGATLNLNSGANVAVNSVSLGAGGTGSTLSIATGATLAITSNLHLGEAANSSSTVTQTGGDVTFGTQLRIGHFATETSSYTISGGTLTATAAAPGTFPFTTGATEQNGGIYLGIDGTGNVTQNGGTVSTNFVVLDNRTETVAGANIATGIETYALNGGTLVLKNAQGVISRFATTLLSLNGGTIQAAAGISPNLDIVRANVAGTSTIDTNGANTFNLYGGLTGSGTLNLIGGGNFTTLDSLGATSTTAGNTGTGNGGALGQASFNVAAGNTLRANRTGTDAWSGALSGAGTLVKQNTGTLTLSGSGSGFTGAVLVAAGRLDVPTNLSAASVTVADGASLSGEPTIAAVALGTTTGSTLFFNGASAGALTATNLTLNGTTTVDFSVAPTSTASPITVLNYGSVTGGLTFTLANAASYRAASIDTTTPGTVLVNVTTKDLTWTGTGGAPWDVNTTTNWNDTAPAPDKFFAGDNVTFGDGPAQVAVTVASGVAPFKTSVTSATNNYTLTSTGVGIAGSGNLEKSGASTLTLAGTNTYAGRTIISGGVVSIAAVTSLGSAGSTNSIALSNGGRLTYTGSAAADLGINRAISVGTGGGVLSHNNIAGVTISVPGNISGGGDLLFNSVLAGGGTFALSGDNSGYTGNIAVTATSTGLTTVRLATPSAAPSAGSITLNYPAAGANGNATTLDLIGTSLPAAVTVNMTSFLNGAISLRSQITSSGIAAVNGPIIVTGNAIAQLPAAGVFTVNGNITEGIGGFTGTFFPRNTGTVILNGTVTLPSATLARTEGGNLLINSTGNSWAFTGISQGTITLGINDALATTAPLTLGQNDAVAASLNLNGFNQTVPSIETNPTAVGANTTGKSITSATPATLTVNQASTKIYAGVITGAVSLVKDGVGNLTLSGGSSFTGNVAVNGGTLVAGGATVTSLGSATSAGRTVTVNNAGTVLSFTTNNVFGNGVANANLPTVVLNSGTTLTSVRYNVLGPVALNGGTLTQASTDAGSYEGFQFRGDVTVGGSAVSTITTTNAKANHLNTNTIFTVADVTGSGAEDLVVSAPLRNQSADFASAAGGFTKTGAGTMSLTAANVYTGLTTIANGTLQIGNGGTSGTLGTGGGVTNNAALTFNRTDAALSVGNLIGGTGTVAQNGTGTTTLTAKNTYTGGTTVNAGTLALNAANTAVGVIRGVATVNAGGTLLLSSANALGFGAGTKVDTLNVVGGLVNTTAVGDQGWGIAINLTAGTLQSNGGTSDAAATSYYALGGGSSINSLASATASTVSGRINLREGNPSNALAINVADGAALTDLNVTAAITQLANGYGVTKTGNGTLTLGGAQNYSTLTTSAGTTNVNGSFIGGTGTIAAGATTNINSAQSLAALNITNGVVVTFGPGPGPAPSFGADGGLPSAGFEAAPAAELAGIATGAPAALVPEPGSIGLLMVGALGLLGRRRRA